MPLIPGINQRSVAPDAANTPYFKIETTTDEFGAGVSKSMLGLGNSLIDGATTALDVTKKLTAKAKAKAAAEANDNEDHITLPMPDFSPDLSKAIEANNAYNALAQNVQSNFFQLSGKDAIDGQAAAHQQLAQSQADILANAPTPAAANLARGAMTRTTDETKASIDSHVATQQRVYDDDLDSTQIAQANASVGLRYNDDRHYLTQLHVANEARADQVLRAYANDNPDADPSTVKAAITSAQQTTASSFIRTRMDSALAQGDVTTAAALHQRWGSDLLPADWDVANQHLTFASFNQEGQQAGAKAMLINQPAPLGRQRNADMVLHRRGGDTVDQLADAGSAVGLKSSSSTPPAALSSHSVGPEQLSGDDIQSTKVDENTSMPTATANHAMFGRGRSKKPADRPSRRPSSSV